MTKRLIVNADDYGLTPGVSSGIREGHLKGIVTTATAMMNMPSAREDLQIATVECPKLGLGVHLVLTAGEPLRRNSSSSLARPDGLFYSIEEISGSGTYFEQIDVGELRDEWRAQIENFMKSGARLDHLDSHHHISYYHEKTYEVMYLLAEEYRVGVRTLVPVEDHIQVLGTVSEIILLPSERFMQHFRVSAAKPDGFICSFMHHNVSLATLLNILSELPDGSFELMSHPGRMDAHLQSVSSYSALRQQELAILTHEETLEAVRRHCIFLVTYGDLERLSSTPVAKGQVS
jgi:predicted glycoside hydrolase/deacetylase ChbG (UPF0249 family)